ncbi:hypothetical protein TRFO_20644 [Tritrichomonas foetus]|uniref:Uncharacterized protein n=1 Tax=Tritrichomonas foetus TaxID=1144522 RepID=A0A1J4KLC0_9EUKA|nr:hypothetical protein TRFO_20644 [Tritrichomonas foetus]|eukprot:OHT10173.1 hypothetical protein TRFO_20644 [Tritrichomonas foetus]
MQNNDPETFGILDINPNSITEPPCFTEPATLVALSNLKVNPSDLVPIFNRISVDHQEENFKNNIDLEMKRFDLIQNIINERNRILDYNDMKKIEKPSRNIEKKKKKGRRKNKRKKKSSDSPNVMSYLPPLKKPSKNRINSNNNRPICEPPLPSNRRFSRKVRVQQQVSLVDLKLIEAAALKKQKEDQRMASAEKALERVKEVEKRQEEMKKQKDEQIKIKAAQRMERLRNRQLALQEEKDEETQKTKMSLLKEERKVAKIKRRKMKKFEKEQKWREKNIYGTIQIRRQPNYGNDMSENNSSMSLISQASNEPTVFVPQPPNHHRSVKRSPRI